ncbi:hypothetical protein J0H58_19100 [bacterium]|nr:hypothetical protein [bacterium]
MAGLSPNRDSSPPDRSPNRPDAGSTVGAPSRKFPTACPALRGPPYR